MGKLKTYMVAMQIEVVLKPTIYLEVVAENATEAMKLAKNERRSFPLRHQDQYMDEVVTDLRGAFAEQIGDARATPINCGRASQYHSVESCALCSEVGRKGFKL